MTQENKIWRYPITGGPGAGKTSVLIELKKQGFYCFDEQAEKLIKHAQQTNSNLVPWIKLEEFNIKLVEEMIKDYHAAKPGVNFFDRALPENEAFFLYQNLKIPEVVEKSAKEFRYEPLVFMLPPWKEIYENTKVRKESFEDAIRISEFIKKSYEGLGYEIIELPKTSVIERVDFIKKILHGRHR